MAATQGSVPGLSTNNSNYVPTTEEPKLDSISFRESLKFFQEQLVINNTELSPSISRILNNDININFSEDVTKTEKHESNHSHEYEDIQNSGNKSKISIPTVESILESVRVLRAIQKSQEQRGSKWALNISQPEYYLNSNTTIFTNGKIADKSVIESCGETINDICRTEIPTLNDIPLEDKIYDSVIERSNEIIASHEKEKTDIFRLQHCVGEITADETNIGLINSIPSKSEIKDKKINSKTNTHSQSQQQLETLRFDELASLNSDFSPEKVNLCYNIEENNGLNIQSCIFKINGCRNDDSSEDCTSKEPAQILKTDGSDCNYVYRSNTQDPSTHLRPESRSDTCSSHYVSAECSPCHSLHYDYELPIQMDDTNLSCSSSFVNNDNKKENNFETWTTDSSGICTGTLHDSETREITSSLSSNSIDTNILDYCQTPDKLNEEVIDVVDCAVSEDIRKDSTVYSTLPESVHTSNSDDESYHSCSLSELNSISLCSILKEASKDSLVQHLDSHKFNEPVNSSPHEIKNTSHSYDIESRDVKEITETGESKFTKTTPSTSSNQKCNETTLLRNESSTNNSFDAETLDVATDICNSTVQNTVTITESGSETLGKKVASTSWNFDAIVESLYPALKPAFTETQAEETYFETNVYIESRGAFCNYPEGLYQLVLQNQSLWLTKESDVLFTMPLNYSEVCVDENALQVDNKLGRCIHLKCNTPSEAESLKEEIEHVSLKDAVPEVISLVHYPLKSHRNVIIIDLGSCSTRAGILMDQPTLPFIFFPSVCATDKTTGKHVYGKEAIQQEIRKNSTLSFPLRSSIKIIKHNIEVELLEGLFKKIFHDLRVEPKQYTVQVCLPRTLSINTQNALVKLLLEDLQVPSVSLTHQALLTLYAHKVGTGIVVDIGDRMEIVPVVDGFIVENGVTRLPYGGQRLIHHMKHALAEKHISLSNEIESFVVQYISEKLCYVAENYESESEIAIQYPQSLRKSVTLETFAKEINCLQVATLEEARFKIPEGLFKPDLWGLDSQGVHQLVQKAIQAASVDVRKTLAGNIYISGGVTMIPGFLERLTKEVTNLNAPRINPKVTASNYRYHCTYIGACEFARMEVFSNVCLTKEEYRKCHTSSLKKFVLCF